MAVKKKTPGKQAGGAAAKSGGAAKDPAKAKRTGESHSFQAEVSQLLHLMVHSVYSQSEIFLRELISNAADACDKLRYEALTDTALLDDDPALAITISIDRKARILSVADNGIGMSRQDLIENLGTIARSGTRRYLESLGDKGADVSLIGQFGVGFYSAFMVAEEVEVISTRAGGAQCWSWRSDGQGAFDISRVAKTDENWRPRGTAVRLHIAPKSKEYLDTARIETIVKTYSNHIPFTIEIIEGGGKSAEVRRHINAAGALWMRPKKDITDEQYREFYAHVGHQFDTPAHIMHYKAEGRHEYTVLLFVPSQRPLDLFDPQRQGRIKLYVKRVFITDEAGLVPSYLRFVRGVIDSEDIPLNISREMLQNNPIVAAISKAVANRVLSELKKLADKKPDVFSTIWEAFGPVLKEGLYEDMERRDKLLELVRFRTTASDGENRSLKDYVADLKENQTAIYFIAGDDAAAIAESPQLEGFAARGIEVLLLSDTVDNFWTTTVLGYDGKPFKSVTQGAADLENIPLLGKDAGKTKPAASKAAMAALIAALKQALGEKVSDVRVSQRLVDSPVCLVSQAGGFDRGLEKILGQQPGGGGGERPRILEINPDHGVIASLAKAARSGGGGFAAEDTAWLLFDQARILDGETVSDPADFSDRLMRMMAANLDAAPGAKPKKAKAKA